MNRISIKELNERIQQSEDDFENGRFINARELSKKFNKSGIPEKVSHDWWNNMSEEEKHSIDRGLEESKRGEGNSAVIKISVFSAQPAVSAFY